MFYCQENSAGPAVRQKDRSKSLTGKRKVCSLAGVKGSCLPYLSEKRCLLSDKFIKVVATGFGSGFAPFAPGTAGTIVAIPVYLIFSPLSWPLYLLSALALTFLAVYVSQEAEKVFDKKDAPQIVIDEIAGFLWTMSLVSPTLRHVLLGFFLFRFFDIIKPFPARLCQERLPGGYGVVFDDVVAGIYANIVLLALIAFFGI
jgi:phosphatidylglycerophosphatase A